MLERGELEELNIPLCGLFMDVSRNDGGVYELDSLAFGRVVRKPVNANPGLKVNRGNNFSCIKVLSIAYVLRSLRLLMLKTEGQKI